jgi:hypothetical protein
MEAMVSNPKGGFDDFLATNLSACLKLQYVSGILGLTIKIFIILSHLFGAKLE